MEKPKMIESINPKTPEGAAIVEALKREINNHIERLNLAMDYKEAFNWMIRIYTLSMFAQNSELITYEEMCKFYDPIYNFVNDPKTTWSR